MWIGLNSDHDAIGECFGLLMILNNDDAFEYYYKVLLYSGFRWFEGNITVLY